MQALCCYRGPGAPSDRNLSTSIARLPAQPARTALFSTSGQAASHLTISLPDTRMPSLMTSPRFQATLDPFVLEVDESDSEDEPNDQRGSPTSTLSVFKSRFIRRLSQRSQSKRQSQRGISNRDEELARRAELRRLRHKRIKEELESEEETETRSNELNSIPCTSQSTSALPEISRQGPRHNIEFSVYEANDVDSERSYTPAPEMVALALPIVMASTSLRQHRTLPATAVYSSDSSAFQAGKAAADHEPSPEMPASPQLEPIRLSDAGATSSIASWSLSYSAGQLADYIGDQVVGACERERTNVKLLAQEPINQLHPTQPGSYSSTVMDVDKPGLNPEDLSADEKTKPMPSSMMGSDHGNNSLPTDPCNDETHSEQSKGILDNTTSSDQYSPLDLWLHASRTLQSISHTSTRRNSDSILENRPNIFPSSDFGSSINSTRIKSSSHLGPCLESNLLKIPGSFSENKLPGQRSTSGFQASKGPKSSEIVSQDVNSASNIQPIFSLRYRTRSMSVDHIRPDSSLSFTDVLRRPQEFQKDTCNKYAGHNFVVDADKSDASSYKTAPAHSIIPETSIYGKNNEVNLSIGSTTASETASFKQREAELESIAKRFAGSRGWHHVRRSPVVSKFREEFNHYSTQAPRKSSLLAKFLPKKEKPLKSLQKENQSHQGGHQNCLKDAFVASHLTTGGPYTSVVNRRGQHFSSEEGNLVLEETATDLWQRAVRLEAERREAQHIYQTKPWHSRRSSKAKAYQPRNESSGGLEPLSSHVRDVSSVYSHSHYGDRSEFRSPRSMSLTGHAEAQVASASSRTSNRIHEETQHQLEQEGSSVSRAPGITTNIHTAHKSNVIPESWAKWSSHDRAERNGATGTNDSVIPKDFAMTSVILGPDKEKYAPTPIAKPRASSRQSLSAKISRALRDSFAKFVPGRERGHSPVSIHRNRPASAGYLEYPELELLPQHGVYKELDAIEKTIDQIKRSSVTIDTRPRCLSGASSRTPLSFRFAQEVHNFQHGDRSSSPNAADFLNATAHEHLNTPIGKQITVRAISAASQQYGTPMTHISYEDCIPKHMLDENSSTKSDTTVMIKRSKSAVEHNVTSLPNKYRTWNGRAKSTSIKRSRRYSSDLKNILSVEREKNMKIEDMFTVEVR